MCTHQYSDMQGCLQAFFWCLMTLSALSLPTTSPLLSNALTRQHVHVPAMPCTSMSTCQHANVPTNAPTHRRASMQSCKQCAYAPAMRRHTNAPHAEVWTCQHTSMPMCTNVCMLSRQHACLCTYPCPGVPVPLSPTLQAHPL